MVTVGTDSHKRTHTFMAVDVNSRHLAHTTVAATPAGDLEGLRSAKQWRPCTCALEDCWHLSRRREADLLCAGEAVVRVPPKLMGGARRGGRQRGKSDRTMRLPLPGSWGNPSSKAALHLIAITQIQRPGPARHYIDRRVASSDTKPKPSERQTSGSATRSSGRCLPTTEAPPEPELRPSDERTEDRAWHRRIS